MGRLVLVSLLSLLVSGYTLDIPSITPLELEHVSVDAWKIQFRRDPYQPEHTPDWDKGAQFNLNLRVLEIFRWENALHMDGTRSQLRNAGWEFQIFMDYFQSIQPFYYHHSEHALDETGVDDPRTSRDFPVVDTIGVRMIFYDRLRRRN